MCSICHHDPCLPGCPNETWNIVGHCIECEEPIYAGEEFCETEKGMICGCCLGEMSGSELAEMLGLMETA